jgi:predicted nuclease with TOPRIM domain
MIEHPEIAIACAAAALSALTLVWLLATTLAHRRLRTRGETLESKLGALRDDLARADAASAEATECLRRLDQAYTRMTTRLRFVERRVDGRAFDQAIDSARQGIDPGTLAEQFGLSRGEAELVARMHGRPKSA